MIVGNIMRHTYAVTECFVDRIGSHWLDALSHVLSYSGRFDYWMQSV
jgi:hypothetical protein